jgi:hypothetical protein
MKFSSIFVLFNLCNVYYALVDQKESAVSIACKELIDILATSNIRVTICNHVKDKGKFDEILLKSLKIKNLQMKVMSDFTKFLKKDYYGDSFSYGLWRFDVKESTILIIDSTKALNEFNKRAQKIDSEKQSIQLYVYCHNVKSDELMTFVKKKHDEKIFKRKKKIVNPFNDLNDIVHHEYFILNENESIKLVTFVWYTPQACSTPQMIEINRFDKNTSKWNNTNFSIEKHKTFYGCDLIFGFEANFPEFIQTNHAAERLSGLVEAEGYGVKLIRSLSKRLNFTFKFISVRRSSVRQGPGALLPDLDLYFASDILTSGKDKVSHSALQLNIPTTEYFAVPPGVLFTSFEKLIIPFNLKLWLLTLFVFIASFATIFVIERMKIEIQHLVFGEKKTSPFFNVLAHFFGLSQVVVPRGNFARFLLMSFILLSFMIRTLYQGVFVICSQMLCHLTSFFDKA